MPGFTGLPWVLLNIGAPKAGETVLFAGATLAQVSAPTAWPNWR